jgi:hypothetical protein
MSAVRLSLGTVLEKAIQFIGNNVRDVALVTPSLDAGLLLGLSHHGYIPTKDEYELMVWGRFAQLSEGIATAKLVSQWDVS